MREVYLVKIDSGANNNKYYRMVDDGSGTFHVEYGRVGATCQKASYPISQWEKKYTEKIRKGYIDRTNLRIVEQKKPDEVQYKEIDDETVAQLVEELRMAAGALIKSQYTVAADAVTMAMVKQAERLMNELVASTSLREFNSLLEELFGVIPRRMGKVSENLAETADDIPKIISRERDILDVMAGQVQTNVILSDTSVKASDKNRTILDVMGLKIVPAKKTEISKIKGLLGESKEYFDFAWKVVNKKTQKAFDAFMEKHPIETKLLWHGSRTENWWSILNTGLVLRPQAQITGKMFGNGIYFAPKARKSIGYTSLSGSYWAGGRSNHAYMAVFEIGYGNPRHVSTSHGFSGYNYKRLKQDMPDGHCVHAHAGQALRNDEIIIYREDQLTIRYLVRLKNPR